MSLARQSQWLLADRIVMVASLFATGVIVARCYGPVGYGAYLIASAVVQTIVGAIASGADVPFVRAFVRAADPGARDAVVRRFALGLLAASGVSGFVIAGIAALSANGLFAGGDGAPDSQLPAGLMLAGLASLPQLPLWLGEWRLRASGQAARIATLRVPLAAAGLCVRLALAAAGVPLWGLVVAIGLEASLVALAMWWRWDDGYPMSPAARPVAVARDPLGEAVRLGVAALLVVAFFRVNPLVVGAVSGVAETARYGAALSLVLAFDVLTSSLSAAAFPRLVGAACEPVASLPDLLRIGRLCALLSTGFVAATVLFGEVALTLVYGEAYRDAYPVLVALSLTTPFTSSAAIRGLYINLLGRSELHVLNALVGLAVLVPGSLWLASAHGALGAAIAMVVACAASGVAASFAFATTRPMGVIQLKSFVPAWGAAR